MIGDLRIDEKRKQLYYEKGYWGNGTLNDAWNARIREDDARPYIKEARSCALTYGTVDDRAARLAAWLSDAGIGNGDVVSFQIPQWTEFSVVYVACLKLGAVMHPISPRSDEEATVYALAKAESKAYLAPSTFRNIDYEERFERIATRVPSIACALFIDRESPIENPDHTTFSSVLETYRPHTMKCPSKSDDVACILATSGSTGTPKLALLTHNNILFSERSYLSVLDLDKNDRMWMPSPLNHATGFFHGLIAVMLLGGCTVLQQGYTPQEAVRVINFEQCTWSHGATPFIYDILKYLRTTHSELPSLRLYLCGGAPVPSNLIREAHEHGILLCESYGSTESCPHVYVPPEKCLEWDGRWSGIPYEGIEIRAVDVNHCSVPPGVQGEEASRGPHQFVGYLNDPERTDRALDSDGWFYSGDLCFLDENGRVRINGRIKEIIIRGGENISAIEVDANLAGCPDIRDFATIGMPDERLGERICTFVVPDGTPPTLDDVKAFLESRHVDKHLWPERIELVERIPYTPTGKVQRHLLAREIACRMGRRKQT